MSSGQRWPIGRSVYRLKRYSICLAGMDLVCFRVLISRDVIIQGRAVTIFQVDRVLCRFQGVVCPPVSV
ncbi:MAG: hypothetical protein CM1200mP41_13040 [Gammaproteobacteria bacterium]|nr:MAG: hypothetical protein CM1200mP41_13040 [Gammaproteobacteria bacterium]